MNKEASHEAQVEDIPRSAQRLRLTVARKQSKHPRKERRDKGKKLIKPRDLVVLLWIAQQYAARLDHVQELLSKMPGRGGRQVSPSGLTFSAVLQVVDRWVTLGLVEYRRIYDGEPGWVHVTPYGLRMLHLSFARHTPAESTLPHLHNINCVRLEVERRHPGYQWVSERMLRAAQPRREEGSLVPHLPDAQVLQPKAVALEVERSPKSPKELDGILIELLITGTPTADAEHPLIYTTVWYFVTEHTRRGVEEARDRLPAELQARVKVYSLETLAPLS
jgi:hypothetical protein